MPRQARLDIPGTLHHIMIRGLNKSKIFRDRQDKRRFLSRLGRLVGEGKYSVNAGELANGGRRRKVSALRAKIAKRGVDELGLSLAELARHLGVSTSSIAKAIARAEDTGEIKANGHSGHTSRSYVTQSSGLIDIRASWRYFLNKGACVTGPLLIRGMRSPKQYL